METLSLFLILSGVVGVAHSEGTTTGTLFYFVLPPISSHTESNGSYVIITNPTATDAELSIIASDLNILDFNVTVNKNYFNEILLPENVFSPNYDSLQRHGIKLNATNGISVQVTVFIRLKNAIESFTVLPFSALDSTYQVIAPALTSSSISFVSIVTKNDQTRINITFQDMSDVILFNNITANVIIDQGQENVTVLMPSGYNVLTLWYNETLTGMKLFSDNNIAVFSGCLDSDSISNTSQGLLILDQVPSANYLGYQYLVNNFGNSNDNSVILLATVQNTTIMSYDNKTCLGGDIIENTWIHTEISSPLIYMVSSQPLLVAHIIASQYEYSMYYATPLDGYSTSYKFPVFESGLTIIKSGISIFSCDDTNGLLLNNTAVNVGDVTGSYSIEVDGMNCTSTFINIMNSGLYNISHNSGVIGGYVYYSNASMVQVHSLGGNYFSRNKTCNDTQSLETDNCIYVDLECPYEAPVVLVENTNLTVQLGVDVILFCSFHAIPSPMIQWFKNGTVINETSSTTNYTININMYGDSTNSTLTIRKVDGPDSSTYECRATNPIGNDTMEILLVVTGDPPLMTTPSFQYKQGYIRNDVSLPCKLESASAVLDVYWTSSSNENHVNTTGIKYKHGDITKHNLVVKNSSFDDTGVYNCHATNYFGTSKGPDILLIVFEETVTTEMTTSSAVINQPTNPTTSSLVLKVTVGKRNITVLAGENATLNSTVQGTFTDIYWKKTQGGLVVKIDVALNPTKASGSNISNPSLTLYNLSAHDEGVYSCVVSNGGKTTSGETIKIEVLDQTVVTFVYVPEERKQEYLNNKTTALKKELSVDKTSLSSTVRLKTSAPDSRPSAAATGALGIVLLTLTFGTMILLDIPVLLREIRTKSLFWETVVESFKTFRNRLNTCKKN